MGIGEEPSTEPAFQSFKTRVSRPALEDQLLKTSS